jgi:hypothetical protein
MDYNSKRVYRFLSAALLCVYEIRKLERVTDEKDRSIIANKVIVAFFGVKFYSETTGVPFRVGRSLFASNGGKACKDFSKLLSGNSSPST